jgi:drug/metabolite transporter (DMT)-like permease
VLFMQALSPFVAVGLAWLLIRERATRRTWMATVVALVGVGLMVGGPGGAPFSGFAITFVMTVSFAFVIVLTRRYRAVSMLPALVIGNSLLVIFVGPFASFGSIDRHDLLFLAVLGLLQTALGQALFAIGARLVPSAEVALITLLEVVLGPLWVWLAYEERPSDATLLGGLIVLVAVIVQATDRALEPIRPVS